MKSEPRGQILVVVAAGMVVLLGIAALVIDLGFSWMLHRQEQNAVDPASIAAARWLRDPVTGDPAVNMPAMEADACFYAQENGFFQSDPGCDTALNVTFDLQVKTPPISGDYQGRPGFVQVIIHATHPLFFGRLFGQDTAFVSTGATAANTDDGGYGSSLHALDPHGCDAGMIQGNGGPSTGAKVTIQPLIDPDTGLPFEGGYAHINSDCDGPVSPEGLASCGGGTGALKVSGNSSLTAPAAYTYGDCALNGGATITTDDGDQVHQGALPVFDPMAGLRGPAVNASMTGARCGTSGTRTAPASSQGCGAGGINWTWVPCADDASIRCVTLSPGVYYGGWHLSTDKYRIQMEPGIYIIAGGGIKQTGSIIEAIAGAGGPSTAQVMIYNTDNPLYAAACAADWAGQPATHCQQGVDFTSGIKFQAYAIGDFACSIDPTTCPYKGMLLWHDWRASCPLLSCDIKLGGGTQALAIGGTIYAANQLVVLSGSGVVTGDVAAVQIVSYRWKIVGNSEILMPYDPRSLYQLPQRGLVD